MEKLKKKKFYVEANESVSQCLDRMASEGYTPIRRMEEPIFYEVKRNGKVETEVKEQKIVFEGSLIN